MKNIQVLANKVNDLISEVETYSFYKENLVRSLDKLFALYQQGKFTYFEYEKEQKKLLKGKTKEDWINYYNSYILSVLKKIEMYNSQIFYEAYNDTAYLRMEVLKVPKVYEKPVERPAARPAPKIEVQQRVVVPIEVKPAEAKPEERPVLPEVRFEVPEEEPKVMPGTEIVEVKPSVMERLSIYVRHLFAKKQIEGKIKEIGEVRKKPAVKARVKEEIMTFEEAVPQAKEEVKPSIKKKKQMFSFLLKKEKPMLPQEEKPEAKPHKEEGIQVEMGRMFGLEYLRNIFSRSQEVKFTDKSSEIPLSTIQLETLRRKARPEIEAQIEKITATALTKEAARIRSIMERRKVLKIYQPSFFGAIANIAIKKISLWLLDNFPDFFKEIYHALRLANIKVLSNTYVNMMVLGVISSFIAGLFFFALFFTATALPISQIIFRTFFMSMLLAMSIFAGFYAYPYQRLKQRRRSINTNLPFAINHMAAVAGSGVSPVRMFKLISESKEYGDVSVEIEKIVNYVEIFGYDILTALKTISSTTPSTQFKDFFEGMISTTQSGGDLKAYLSQKAEEAMMNYKLDRQKYTETIATYSDIYTGILIAAPLFFVASLSMVSLLGGKVGGMNVNVIIVMGTYIVIPLLNVCFLAFLEITQPEV